MSALDLSNPEAMIAEQRRRAERRAKGLPLHETAEEVEQLREKRVAEEDARLEKEIQRDVYKIYRAFGCELYWMSQARATRQTAGVPDLIVFHPRTRSMFYHECKTPRGKLSPAQVVFQEQCTRAGITVVVGGVDAAEEQLVAIRAAASRTAIAASTLTQAE